MKKGGNIQKDNPPEQKEQGKNSLRTCMKSAESHFDRSPPEADEVETRFEPASEIWVINSQSQIPRLALRLARNDSLTFSYTLIEIIFPYLVYSGRLPAVRQRLYNL